MRFYATFGFGQPNEKKFIVIDDCPSLEAARKTMFSIYGQVWSCVYDEDDWTLSTGKTQEEEYGITSFPFKISLNVTYIDPDPNTQSRTT